MNSLRTRGLTKLRIQKRRVTGRWPEPSEEGVVDCPRRAGATTVDHCIGCAQYEGRSFDTARDLSYVVCHAHEAAAGTPAEGGSLVADLMTATVFCLTEDIEVGKVANLFLHENVTSAPVIDAERRPIGMVSSADLVRVHGRGTTVAQVMTRLSLSISARAPIESAAELMARAQLHQLPVVADDDQVIGLITTLDVLRWVARRDLQQRTA